MMKNSVVPVILLFALVLLSTEAMRWGKSTQVKVDSVVVAERVGRTMDYLAFHDGAVDFAPHYFDLN
jgi:hypothetical protein